MTGAFIGACRGGLAFALLALAILAPSTVRSETRVEVALDARPTNEYPDWGLIHSKQTEFRPADNEQHRFEFALLTDANATLQVLSADGDVIRTLLDNVALRAGRQSIAWDGRDDDGTTVPDEAYSPRLEITTPDARYVDDPRQYSGGEILRNLPWSADEKALSFTLPSPARVMIRTGIEDGPVMRILRHWQPAAAGRSTARWDGYDKDQVEYFADREDRWSIVMAYRLPQHVVITTGNSDTTYRTYREQRGWEEPPVDLANIPLQRNGTRLSRNYFMPRQFQPSVITTIDARHKPNQFGLPVATDTLRLHIDVPKADRWILDASFYEASVYLDYQFVSEEEQGFVPMVWDVDVSKLTPGRHIATVQLFGFGGFIAVDTVDFWVESLTN